MILNQPLIDRSGFEDGVRGLRIFMGDRKCLVEISGCIAFHFHLAFYEYGSAFVQFVVYFLLPVNEFFKHWWDRLGDMFLYTTWIHLDMTGI